MKNINVIYNRNGKIELVSDCSMYFEQENDALRIDAQIPADEGKLVRAYIKASKNSDVLEAQPTAENMYSVTVGNECMSKGTLYVGFEAYDESGYIERYEPLKVYVDSFVNPGDNSAENVYVVTVDVAETETLEPDTPAYVENVGTKKDMRLKIGIPRGKDGEPGYSPIKGKDYFTTEEQQGFKADILTEIEPVLETKADAKTQKGGFSGGEGASANTGGAIGLEAQATLSGGAVGRKAYAITGGAIGSSSKTTTGGAVGNNAESVTGGAIGCYAIAGGGFSGGVYATVGQDTEGNYIDAIQLGQGHNANPKSLQVYSYTLMNGDGTIPEERLTKAKAYTDEKIGDIDTALNSIIAMQNELIGGGEV